MAVLYCTIWGDHGSRGRYDNPRSAQRPVQVGPSHKAPSVCKMRVSSNVLLLHCTVGPYVFILCDDWAICVPKIIKIELGFTKLWPVTV